MKEGIDTLVLGCTHFGFLRTSIQQIVGPQVTLIVGTDVVPERLGTYLEKHTEIEESLIKDGQRHFYTTDPTDRFQTLGSRFFGEQIEVEKAVL
jgi:glutamate racemase